MSHTYEYPRPGVCADIIVSSFDIKFNQEILLIKRKHDPFRECWALPGGFVNEGERFIEAAKRELCEETGIKAKTLWNIMLADKPDRDPRGWTISYVFQSIIIGKKPKIKAADDASDCKWFDINYLPKLAFDHEEILNYWLNGKGYYAEN